MLKTEKPVTGWRHRITWMGRGMNHFSLLFIYFDSHRFSFLGLLCDQTLYLVGLFGDFILGSPMNRTRVGEELECFVYDTYTFKPILLKLLHLSCVRKEASFFDPLGFPVLSYSFLHLSPSDRMHRWDGPTYSSATSRFRLWVFDFYVHMWVSCFLPSYKIIDGSTKLSNRQPAARSGTSRHFIGWLYTRKFSH